jgi:hypothetical protein
LTVWLPSAPYSSSVTVTSSTTQHRTLGVKMAHSKPAAIHHSNIWLLSFCAVACRRRASYSCSLTMRCALFWDGRHRSSAVEPCHSGTKVNTRLASPSPHGLVVADVNLVAGRFKRYP